MFPSNNIYSLTALPVLRYTVLTDIWETVKRLCWVTVTPQARKHYLLLQNKETFDVTVTPPPHDYVMGREHFLLILMSPWIFWCAKFSQWQRLLQVLIVTEEKMVTRFAVWTICMVSSMIASWFSIARKCEELPLQRDVCPTSTNPQLMASRGNRPQQPHILQRFHVHNSFARLEKSESQIVKTHQQSE